jgi:hemoglobin
MSVSRWTIAIAIFAVAMQAVAWAPAGLQAQSQSEPAAEVEVPTPPGQETGTKVVGGSTLYQRLGGYDAIAEGVDDVLKRIAEDELLRRFLAGASDKQLRRLRQKAVDYVCEKTGGPCFYIGRDAAEAHADAGVTEADWERASELMAAVLDARGVQGELREEIGGFLADLREDIVEK